MLLREEKGACDSTGGHRHTGQAPGSSPISPMMAEATLSHKPKPKLGGGRVTLGGLTGSLHASVLNLRAVDAARPPG